MWPDAASQALASKLCRLKTQTGDSVLAAGALSTIARPESVAEVLVEALVYSAAKPTRLLVSSTEIVLTRMITGSEDPAPRPVMTCHPNLSRSDPEHQRIH